MYCEASAMLAEARRVAFPDKLSLPKGGVNFTLVIFEEKNVSLMMRTAEPSNLLM